MFLCTEFVVPFEERSKFFSVIITLPTVQRKEKGGKKKDEGKTGAIKLDGQGGTTE